MNVPPYVSCDQTRLEYEQVGYGYFHLDRNGRLSEKRTCQLMINPGYHTNFIDNRRQDQDGVKYFSYFHGKLNPPLIDARRLLYKKVYLEKELVHVGNSSLVIRCLLKSPNKKGTLAIGKYLSVHVDRETRKKRQLPLWFREKFGYITQEPLKIELPDVPRHWNCKVRVPPSDIDNNNHVNYAAYITYCQNAVYKHQKQQSNLLWFNGHGLEEIELRYLADSVEGDELSLYVQQLAGPGVVFCVSVEKDGQLIVKARLVYTSSKSPGLTSSL